jgi:hypothetical protein
VHPPENVGVDRWKPQHAGDAAEDQQAAKESATRPPFDMEETADIVLPPDHPIFRR